MKNITTTILLFIAFTTVFSQGFTDSNLPIVIITTDVNPSTGKRYEIVDEPKVPASMKIISRPDGARNYVTDQNNALYLNYDGKIGIELRGSTSRQITKKPYGLTTRQDDNITNRNERLLGMPSENDWVLNGLAFDTALIRDFLTYDIARNTGNYAPRGVYCEVIVNNDYKGLYVLMEKIKIDEHRVHITKMTPQDNTNPVLSGGYIVKSDKAGKTDSVAWTMPTAPGKPALFLHENPGQDEITNAQSTAIYDVFMQLAATAAAGNSSITNGYPAVIDIPSFIDFMLVNELASNVDAYQFSTFFHKERNGKLRAGPVWDFNFAYGNDMFEWNLDRSLTDLWQFDDGENTGPRFWKQLFTNPQFQCLMARRWKELRSAGRPFDYNVISARMDELASHISEAAAREQARWDKGAHMPHISQMKTWLRERLAWLDARLADDESCRNTQLPALVISKINYNPLASGIVPGDSLEFVEITNNSEATVDLTRYYFREPGFTYQFEAGAKLAPRQRIFLARNARDLEAVHGIKAYGEYTGKLRNTSQKLILADAFGNSIDEVEYSFDPPWPGLAGGGGAFLEIIDLNADNNVATNWKASDRVSGVRDLTFENTVRLYPNPARTTTAIHAGNATVKSYYITDVLGRTVLSETNPPEGNMLQTEQLTPNIYFVRIRFDNGAEVTRKLIKE